ncbi:ef-hand domain-containing protein [Cyclospora cayetanensis]|uniref:Ef-hand domain-containing protein n=1 Tax=Cyclospora cayetanensis TaxID=88456 RepID=A0A1D3D7U1_9EIME|nr:ef-hand domain-containing protein [Cyclospora cayetanensis]
MEQQEEEHHRAPPPNAPSLARATNGSSERKTSQSSSHATQDADPPRKRRLLFPKARPKKMQEFLGRRLDTFADSGEGRQDATPEEHTTTSSGIDGLVCSGASFEEAMAAAGVLGDVHQPQSQNSSGLSCDAKAIAKGIAVDEQKLKDAPAKADPPTSTGESASFARGPQDFGSLSSSSQGGSGASSGSRRAVSSIPPPISTSSSLLDSSCLGVQRLTLQSPTADQPAANNEAVGLPGGRSPPEKRPSSGPCDFAEEEDALHGMEALGDGGLGPLQKTEDFSEIPLATRLQAKAIKQRVHGCDEVVMRLGSCSSCRERIQLWDALVKPHLSGILKDTNALVGSKALEMLQALIKADDPSAGDTLFPAAAALPLLQQSGKLMICQLLSNPRHFSTCSELLLRLSQASAECAAETVALVAAAIQQLLEEKKGNVAAVKGQGVRVVGSCVELLLKMLQAFGLQLMVAVGGIQRLIHPLSSFAACSDKRVRTALASLAATALYFTRMTAGDAAAAAAKKVALDCLKGSKAMQSDVEQLLEKFASVPPPTPTLSIGGIIGGQEGDDSQAAACKNTDKSGGSLASMLVAETDVLRTVCQQQTDWVLRVTEGRQSTARGEREGDEEPSWKVKLQAWQQLESALRDCAGLYKKNPFLHQQLLPLMHRVLTAEPTLPVVACVLKTLQLLVQLLLQPRGVEGAQQLQQQLRALLPDALGKLKVNNRPVQAAACHCIGTYLASLPIDVVVGDLLPVKEKVAHYQKLLLDELTKAVGQQAGKPALQKVAAVLLTAARAAAEDGNASVRAAGVGLLAAVSKHAEGDAIVEDTVQKLSEQKRQQLQKVLASSGSLSVTGNLSQPPASSPRRPLSQSAAAQGVPFSRMRSRGIAAAAAASERQGGAVAASSAKAVRRQAHSTVLPGSAGAKLPLQRSGTASVLSGGSSASASHAACSAAALWEVPHAAVSPQDAEKHTRAVLPAELLQGLDATIGQERKRAYQALESWCRRACDCSLCSSENGQMEMEGKADACRLEACRRSAVHILLHLRTKLRGFRERTAVLEDACISCLQAIVGGLLLPEPVFLATAAAAKDSAYSGPSIVTPRCATNSKKRSLPPVDRSIVNIVLEPLGDRLGDPRVGSGILTIGLLLSLSVSTPTTVAAQLALMTDGRVAGGRFMQGVCALLELLLQQWGLQAFSPPKQLLILVRQMLEPNKGPRSVVFPLLKRLHAELGDKAITAMLVAHPLPDDVKHALKQQRQLQPQQPQQSVDISGPRMQHGYQEDVVLKALNELMHILVAKAGDRAKPEGLSGLLGALRRRLADQSSSTRRQVLLCFVALHDHLSNEALSDLFISSSFSPPARLYKQLLTATAECLSDSDKKVRSWASRCLRFALLRVLPMPLRPLLCRACVAKCDRSMSLEALQLSSGSAGFEDGGCGSDSL